MKTVTEVTPHRINGEHYMIGGFKLRVESSIRGCIILQCGDGSKLDLSASELITAIKRATLNE